MLVVCNGMGRSGSTYQYNLACLFVGRAGIGEAARPPAPSARNTNSWWDVSELQAWAEDDRYHVVKWHESRPFVRESIEGG